MLEKIISLYNSIPGRFVLLALAIGMSTQGGKLLTEKGTWIRALLPAIPVFLGIGLALLSPGSFYVETTEAAIPLGGGAGAVSSSAVELWERYKDQIDLKKALTPKT